MESSAIFLTVFLIASTSGFTIINPQAATNFRSSGSSKFSPSPATEAPHFGTQVNFRNGPIAGYPKVPPPNAHEAGGNDQDLLPPFEDSSTGFSSFGSHSFRRSIDDARVDPKTGYPLIAQPFWRFAGGNEEILDLPVDDSLDDAKAVDPKTGYPLQALPEWKSAGGDGGILELPVEDAEENFGKKEAVDPKTGYPLVADPRWKDAGGNEEILDLPVEEPAVRSNNEAVDPKTGYPLVAQPGWKDAGGDESILELPLEESDKPEVAVDPKTGYPLVAQPSWKDAGGDEAILELPLESEEKTEKEAVDPKTGYPLVAQPGWKDAGGDGDFLQLPVEENKSDKMPNDPKTNYPLIAEPSWKDAGGDGDVLELPLEEPKDANGKPVDPKTGYPIIAEASWKDAGGDGDILQPPLVDNEVRSRSHGARQHVFDVVKLTEVVPPAGPKNFPVVFGNSFSAPTPLHAKSFQQDSSYAFLSGAQKRDFPNIAGSISLREVFSRPVESSYTFAGPDNTFVTVTRFLSPDKQKHSNFLTNNPSGFSQNGLSNDFTERQSFQTFTPRF